MRKDKNIYVDVERHESVGQGYLTIKVPVDGDFFGEYLSKKQRYDSEDFSTWVRHFPLD